MYAANNMGNLHMNYYRSSCSFITIIIIKTVFIALNWLFDRLADYRVHFSIGEQKWNKVWVSFNDNNYRTGFFGIDLVSYAMISMYVHIVIILHTYDSIYAFRKYTMNVHHTCTSTLLFSYPLRFSMLTL